MCTAELWSNWLETILQIFTAKTALTSRVVYVIESTWLVDAIQFSAI